MSFESSVPQRNYPSNEVAEKNSVLRASSVGALLRCPLADADKSVVAVAAGVATVTPDDKAWQTNTYWLPTIVDGIEKPRRPGAEKVRQKPRRRGIVA
jgi:hypothetical protein